MALGHLLLRTQTGGWSEQLDPGMNGFDLGLPGPDIRQEHVDLFHQLRDPEIFSNEHLVKMSHAAREKAQVPFINYSEWLQVNESDSKTLDWAVDLLLPCSMALSAFRSSSQHIAIAIWLIVQLIVATVCTFSMVLARLASVSVRVVV